MRRRTTRTGWLLRKFAVVAILAAIMMWVGGFAWFVKSLEHVKEPPLTVTQGIVVLTGGPNRIKAAVGLLESGLGERLLISGVNQTVRPDELRQVLNISAQTLACCIDLGKTALNTRDNAVEAAAWAREHHYRSLRVVTALDHMPRSLVEFRRVMPGFVLVPHPIAAGAFPVSDEGGSWPKLALEYSKYLVSMLRAHFPPPPWLAAILGRFVAHSGS